MDLTYESLKDLVASTTGDIARIRLGSAAWQRVMGFPELVFDPRGGRTLRWRDIEVVRDPSSPAWSVDLELR